MRTRLTLFAVLLAAAPVAAQQPTALTAADYARAEKYLAQQTVPLVLKGAVRANWITPDQFWYRNAIAEGAEYVLVDARARRRTRLFDHERMARALQGVSDTNFSPWDLPFTRAEISGDRRTVGFEDRLRSYTCDAVAYTCRVQTRDDNARGPASVTSPDGRYAAFIREHNLWIREVASGREIQLTTDGQQDYGYATNNAGWTRSDRPIVLWSPDSRKIATFRHDARNVGMMYLVDTRVGHPNLDAWKYPLPGDSAIFMIERVIIHLDGPKLVRLQMPADPHRSTLCDHIVCRGEWGDVQWYPDASHLAFASSSRDHKEAILRVADAETGTVRTVLEEKVPTFYESGVGRVNWHVLPKSNEVIWYSQRDDWGQLYLYDLATGRLKHQITSGEGNVLQLLHIDEAKRQLYFTGAGREPGRDPYFRHFYRIGMDGKNEKLLTPEDADHEITLSSDGRFFVDAYSKPDVPAVSVLRDADGKRIVELEQSDISRLLATGWTPPVPFTVKARDGKTDLYGLMYRPTGFDASKKYPIINHIYPGPQTGSVGSRSFSPARGDTRALAELGFIVVQIDAMGTPMRSKSFHAAYYGNMGDNGLPDQVTGMQQLAQRHSWIDLDRAGIYGHSGGGFASTAAMLRYPDFFKVAVSQAGNHDNRLYEDDWAEKWQGLLVRNPDGTTNYDNQANQLIAGNLKGKLLLAHGTLDDNVPPNNTLILVNELIRANKDFDLIMFPNRRHGFGGESYMTRRRWDYFVKHLMGAEPPKEFEIGRPSS